MSRHCQTTKNFLKPKTPCHPLNGEKMANRFQTNNRKPSCNQISISIYKMCPNSGESARRLKTNVSLTSLYGLETRIATGNPIQIEPVAVHLEGTGFAPLLLKQAVTNREDSPFGEPSFCYASAGLRDRDFDLASRGCV